ncbi:MAG: ABC transporter permease [Candidatus Eremiobacteraeota bacterium]|nr:ABC transporter permease [Candidatus Eremiobacteraeota bacterium]
MVSSELKASYAFIERNLHLMKRYMAWELVFLTYTVVNALSIAFIGVAMGDSEKVLYLVVGAVLWGFLSLLFHEISEAVAWERWEGTIEYTLMAPVRRITYLLGTSISTILYGLMRTVIILMVVAQFLDLSLAKANVPAACAILAVSSLSFIGLGFLGAVLPLLSPEKGPQATHILQAVILLVSGVYYEVGVLPAWLQPLSHLSPATYTLRAMRAALLHGAGFRELGWYFLLLALMGAVLMTAGYGAFLAGVRYARSKGKLSRSG